MAEQERMKLDTNTAIDTLLGMAEHIHDELEGYFGCNGFDKEMEQAAMDYQNALTMFRSAWSDHRHNRKPK